MGSCGTTANALAFGGNTGSPTTATEEWVGSGAPIGAWSTGGSLNTAIGFGSSAGTSTAGLYFGGSPTNNNSTYSNDTESYDGTNWTEVNNLTTARFAAGGVGATNTAALMFGTAGLPHVIVRFFTVSLN